MCRLHDAIVSCAVGVLVSTASAELLDLEAVWVSPDLETFDGLTWTELGYDGAALDTWRVYARFSSPDDTLHSIGDPAQDGYMFSVSTTAPFFNSQLGSNLAPTSQFASLQPDLLWDTFLTIGALLDDAETLFSPGAGDQLGQLADDFELYDGGWYIANFPPQGYPIDGRIVIAQFTVPEGAVVVGRDWWLAGNAADGDAYRVFHDFVTGEIDPFVEIHVPADASTIQAAIAMAAADVVTDVVVAPGTWSGPIDFMGKQVNVVAAYGADVTTIDAGGLSAAVRFVANEGENAGIQGFTIVGGIGDPADDGSGDLIGGGIVIDGSAPRIVDCVLVGNTADRGGGASVRGGSPTFVDCSFIGGSAIGGGAVWIEDAAEPAFLFCDFVDNAADAGGAVASIGATATFDDCQFEENVATLAGGAISADDSALLLTACTFEANRADGSGASGGAIATVASDLDIDLCDFEDNVAPVGGAVAADGSPTMLTASTFTGNTAAETGGAIACWGAPLFANACEFSFNRADDRGGAMFGADLAISIEGSDFRGNSAVTSGHVIEIADGATTTVTDSTFCGSELSGEFPDGGGNAFDLACSSGVGTERNGRLGDVLANAGDVDGDGFDDLIVGAPHHDGIAAEAGQAFVYSPYTGKRLHTFSDAAEGDRFGWAVAGVGDIDDDGHADVAVGAPYAEDRGAGKVIVYSGATGQIIREHLHWRHRDHFGWAIAGGFDVDDDGVPDYVIGVPFRDVAGLNAGSVFVYSGATGDSLATLQGRKRGDRYGSSLAMLEHADADGRADILVGAPRNDQRDTNAGKTYLLAGGSYEVIEISLGREKRDRFGTTVAALGDVDVDGFDDYAVGAPWHQSRGRVDVYSGRTGEHAFFALGEVTGDRFGTALAGVADTDGDGRNDVLVGAPRSDINGAGAGRAYLYGADGALLFTVEGVSAGDRLGTSVAGCVDLSGDGLGEVAIGVPGLDVGTANVGRVEIIVSSATP